MTRTPSSHALEIFEEAADLSGADRQRFLEAQCGGDADLRAQVERLLRAHERQGLLDDPPVPGDDTVAERLQAALADHYVIDSLLGRGGSAIVFLAHERKHERRVVLKVLDPGIAWLYGADRFRREVEIAARLGHPHILGLIDSGEADGLLYYVMPFVEGETLRARLDRAGALSMTSALSLVRDIASALAYAHRAGVVHRDLKPANVLCAGDHAFLMDFGVAKLILPGGADSQQTGAGVVVGTPAYMAPEQRAALPLDHKVDLYSWGLLAAEVFTGRPPPEPGTSVGGLNGAPPQVAALVGQCLETNPALRPADADEIVARLETAAPPRRKRWLAALLALLAGAVLLTLAWSRSHQRPAPATIGLPLAVAPFRNETGDSALGAWGRMAGDWLTQSLQEGAFGSVIGWSAALEATAHLGSTGASDLVAQLARRTGARTIVSGSYYAVGDSLQFRAQVSDAASGEVLSIISPVMAPRQSPQDALAPLRERVLGAVAVLAHEGLPVGGGLRQHPPTYDAYLAFEQGSQRFTAQDYEAAVPLLKQARARDTTFLVPLITLASAWWNMGEFDSVGAVIAELRRNEASLSPYQRLQVEHLDAWYRSDLHHAYDALSRAAELAPDSRAGYNLALLAISLDRPKDALQSLETLRPENGALGPWSAYWNQLAHALHQLGEYGREREAARTLTRRFPDRRVGLALEVRALAAMGDTAEIDQVLHAADALSPNTYWSQGGAMIVAGEELMAHGHVPAGRRYLERGIAWLEAQLKLDPTQRSHRYWLGAAYYDLSRWDDAYRMYRGLADSFPERRDYRSLAAVAAARVQQRSTTADLAPVRPWGRNSNLFMQGRIAAAIGDTARARALFTEAVSLGFEGLPWSHATAVRDLLELGPGVSRLPPGLRITPAAPGT